MALTINEVLAELDRAGLPKDHQPGENGVLTLCVCCPGQMAWTDKQQRWICDRPDCPSHDYPSLIGSQLHFRSTSSGFNGNGHHEQGVVAMATPKGIVATTTPDDRYDGRVIDLDGLLAKPPEPIPWRVHDVVADGTLTIISGESGAGKSWLAQALCTGVAHGHTTAGLLCSKGTALYIDAEMGPRMFVDQRLRPTGVKVAPFKYVDAMGLDISTSDDLHWIQRMVVEMGANLVVIDSLRRLTPSKSENDSDDMAPAVAALAKLARDTNAAIVLVHHKGDSEKFFRGSTAIKDQADALFALLRDPEDEHAPRRLRCRGGRGKMRYSLEPQDVFLEINPDEGGVAKTDAPDAEPHVPARFEVMQDVQRGLPAKTKTEVARKIGRRLDDRGFREAWAALERNGMIEHNPLEGRWEVSGPQDDGWGEQEADWGLDTDGRYSGVVATPDPRVANGHHPPLRLVERDDPGVA